MENSFPTTLDDASTPSPSRSMEYLFSKSKQAINRMRMEIRKYIGGPRVFKIFYLFRQRYTRVIRFLVTVLVTVSL